MSKFKHCVSMAALLTWMIGIPLIGGQRALAGSDQPPEGAKQFAETQFLQIVEGIVFSDQPEEWGFKPEKGNITFSELYPIYALNADFAFGRSDEMILDEPPTWVAVIFQDGKPVNAIGTHLTADGQFGLAALGYPPELPDGLLNLKDGEIIIHDFPKDEYYVFSEKNNSLVKLGQSAGKHSLGSRLTKEQFQKILVERYKNIDQWEEDSSVGVANAVPSPSAPWQAIVYSAVILAVPGGVWFYVRRHVKTRS